MATFLGIDPGLTGALAWYTPESGRLDVVDVPTTGKIVDVDELISRWGARQASIAAVERVGTMPRQGLTSAFNFGRTCGILYALAHLHSSEVRLVTPQQWKFGVGIGANPDHDRKARKTVSRQKATQLLGNGHLFARVKDDGRAEAALIAWYLAHRVHGVPIQAKGHSL